MRKMSFVRALESLFVLSLFFLDHSIAAADSLKEFPRESFFELRSGSQVIGRSSLKLQEQAGLTRFIERSEMKVTLFGKAQLIQTDLDVGVDSKIQIQNFVYQMTSPDSKLEIRGTRAGSVFRVEKIQAGKSQSRDIAIQEPLLLAPLIRVFALQRTLPEESGKIVSSDAFLLEPSALAVIPMSIQTSRTDSQRPSWNLKVNYLNQSLVSKIRGDGSLIEEVTDIAGMPVVARPLSRANFDGLTLVSTRQDLVQQARVDFPFIKNPRNLKSFSVRVSGIPAHQFQLNRHRQKFMGDVLTVTREAPNPKSAPVQSLVSRSDLKKYLDAEVSIPVFDPAIQRTAQQIVKNESDLWKRALAIHDFVYRTLEKRAFVSLPDALEALQKKQGDCNEHAALYTALARAAGIPTRTVVGLVYSDILQSNQVPGFFYHAWVEVFTGQQWIAIDPTWNQIPADVTHLAFVEGGADQQIQIASLMGKIRLSPHKSAEVN